MERPTVHPHDQTVQRNRLSTGLVRPNGSTNSEQHQQQQQPQQQQQIVLSYARPALDSTYPRQTAVYERRHNGAVPSHVPIERMEFDLDGTVRHLTSSQRVRLTQDLAIVETNVNVLNDMLAELRPDTVGPDDLTLLQELYQTCRAMHQRVVEFLSQVSDEEVTPCLLQVNDNLNNAFSRYERFERYRIRALRSEMMSDAAALDLASVRFSSYHGAHPTGALRLAARPQNTQSPMLAITSGRSVPVSGRAVVVNFQWSTNPVKTPDIGFSSSHLGGKHRQENAVSRASSAEAIGDA
ncbi:unnamed protein product [Echinostoma caproni]|uniref:GAT domain-containing protein n=1 Tax=Echinostoma caproni TaxID=27848 RepID=A0A183A5N7_9TREM|nr:unnamed protein product [Echinostoma caproni]